MTSAILICTAALMAAFSSEVAARGGSAGNDPIARFVGFTIFAVIVVYLACKGFTALRDQFHRLKARIFNKR